MSSNIKSVKLTDSNKIQVNSDDRFIRVTNYGLFVAYFEVYYNYKDKVYHKESPNFSMFFSETIPLPEGATDIEFTVYIQVLIGEWESIYSKIFNEAPAKCYQLMGTTFHAICGEIPCNGSDINSPNHNCCRCCRCCRCCDRPDYYNLYNNRK